MRSSLNFAIFSIQSKIQINNNLIKEAANSFKFKQQKEMKILSKAIKLTLLEILMNKIN
jgi:hypothetical protein